MSDHFLSFFVCNAFPIEMSGKKSDGWEVYVRLHDPNELKRQSREIF